MADSRLSNNRPPLPMYDTDCTGPSGVSSAGTDSASSASSEDLIDPSRSETACPSEDQVSLQPPTEAEPLPQKTTGIAPDSENVETVPLRTECHRQEAAGQHPADRFLFSEQEPSSKDTVSDSRSPRGFHELELSRHTGSLLGLPSFDPSIHPTVLFNPWAYLFGPLYFLVRGMWRKGLILAILWILCMIPTAFPEHIPLQQALFEEYAFPHLLLMALSTLFTLLFCTGHNLIALLTAGLFVVVLVGSQPFIVPLDMGNFSAFVWLNSVLLWTALGRTFLFSLLGKMPVMAIVTGGLGVALYLQGLPLALDPAEVPALAYPVICGMMGTYDLYRAKRLKKRFWW